MSPSSRSRSSQLEAIFALQLGAVCLPPWEEEYPFHPKRRWRFDFAWPARKVAVEIEGGVWTVGRHQRPAGFLADIEKYNAAAAAGWWVLRFGAADVKSGAALRVVMDMLSSQVEPKKLSPVE